MLLKNCGSLAPFQLLSLPLTVRARTWMRIHRGDSVDRCGCMSFLELLWICPPDLRVLEQLVKQEGGAYICAVPSENEV